MGLSEWAFLVKHKQDVQDVIASEGRSTSAPAMEAGAT
jgi:hypothetical protein